jgi:tetratricopeptide (TPR) repeat protein/transcriptional regulator with XRE-family HTH domain
MKRRDTHPLRTARCKHNLTIERLAEEAKVGASTVWRAEHNYPINAESRRRLCAYFHTTPQALGLLNHLEQSNPSEQALLAEAFTTEPSPSAYGSEDVSVVVQVSSEETGSEPLFRQQKSADLRQGRNRVESYSHIGEALLTTNGLDTLLDAHWTLDTVLSALRVTLQGLQGLPARMQHALLLGMLSRIDMLDLPEGKRVSEEERYQVKETLSISIAQCWQFFHIASPLQIFIVGQGLLYLLNQTQALLSPEDNRSFYSAIMNLIGSASFFQGSYDIAQATHKKAYEAVLGSSDIWNQTQSLNWQAIAASANGKHIEAIRFIETALHLLTDQTEQDYQRLRAHLLADWAYNASILGDEALARKKLDASVAFLENLDQNEEFDLTRWHQLFGDCMLLNQQYTPAIYHLEQSLHRLPRQWLTRRVLTLLPLARAYAYQQERDMSISVAEQAMDAIQTIDSIMLKQRFAEYLHVLVELFPRDKIVRGFVTNSQHQIILK